MCGAVSFGVELTLCAAVIKIARMIEKAYAYIIRVRDDEPELLVFEQDDENAGVQIPGGTVEPMETIQNAAQREVYEETGLKLPELTLLGSFELHYDELYRISFFVAVVDHSIRNEWTHKVRGKDEDAGMRFHYHWLHPQRWEQVGGDFTLAFPQLQEFIRARAPERDH